MGEDWPNWRRRRSRLPLVLYKNISFFNLIFFIFIGMKGIRIIISAPTLYCGVMFTSWHVGLENSNFLPLELKNKRILLPMFCNVFLFLIVYFTLRREKFNLSFLDIYIRKKYIDMRSCSICYNIYFFIIYIFLIFYNVYIERLKFQNCFENCIKSK